MSRDDYDFEAELANSVTAIVDGKNPKEASERNSRYGATDDIADFENIDDYEDLDDLDSLGTGRQKSTSGRPGSGYSSNRDSNRAGNRSNNRNIIGNDIRSNNSNTNKSIKAKRKKKANMNIVIGCIAVLVIISAIIGAVYAISSNARKNTYAYSLNMALKYYSESDYKSAEEYFNKSLTYYDEADQINIRFYLYQCARLQNNTDDEVKWLLDILNYDNYNEKAISLLAEHYYNTGDSQGLNQLILKYDGTKAAGAVSAYANSKPGVSHGSGVYPASIDVTLFNTSGNPIYYTTDGTVPNERDTLYTEPIHIEKGHITLNAVSIDSNGIVSDVLECNYIINYDVPDKPVVTPASGSYDTEQIISVDNYVADGSYTAYYTLDGSVPTDKSKVYTEPFDMPAGNNVFSVAFVSKDGITSTVIKRNYNLKLAARYDFDGALELLKDKLKEKGAITETKDALSTGESIRFVYYMKQTIDNIDMYLVYFDIKTGSSYVRQEYVFGIDMVTGKIYVVTDEDGQLKSEIYK